MIGAAATPPLRPTPTVWGAAAHLAKRTRTRRGPTVLQIQVTDRCNYSCVHCYETHGDKEEISLAVIDRVLGEVAGLGTLFLMLTGGEVFMRRDADDLLRAARRHKYAVKLLTTGHFIDERRADLIHDLGAIQVDMSFYAGDPAIHDHITQIRGSWRRTLDAARRLRARGVNVTLKSPILAANGDDLHEVVRIARELGCNFAFDPFINAREDGNQEPTELRASAEALRAIYADPELGGFDVVAAEHRERLAGLRVDEKAADQGICGAGWDVGSVTPQGIVQSCHLLPIPCGDLRTQSFAEIWRDSPAMRRIREFTWADIDDCRVCEVRPYCNRCHSKALLEDGEWDRPSLDACRHALLKRDLFRECGVIPESETALPPPLARLQTDRSRPAALRVLR